MLHSVVVKLSVVPIYRSRHEFVVRSLRGRAVRLLDAGNLGDGASMNLRLKEEVERLGGEYVGLDCNEDLVKALHLPNQVAGDLHDAPFPSESFDVIYAGEVIEHTWTPSAMVRECWRLLRPGGWLVLDTPNLYCVRSLAKYFLLRVDSLGDVRRLTYEEAKDGYATRRAKGGVLHQPQHKIFFTPAMITQLLETHGFRTVSVGFTHKPNNVLHRLLHFLFPHGGNHLCVVGEKSTVDVVYADVVGKE